MGADEAEYFLSYQPTFEKPFEKTIRFDAFRVGSKTRIRGIFGGVYGKDKATGQESLRTNEAEKWQVRHYEN